MPASGRTDPATGRLSGEARRRRHGRAPRPPSARWPRAGRCWSSPRARAGRRAQLRPAKPGAALLAVQSGVPVVPAYVSGSGRAWPRGRRLPRPAKVVVTFGPPLRFQRAVGPQRKAQYEAASREMMAAIGAAEGPCERWSGCARSPAPAPNTLNGGTGGMANETRRNLGTPRMEGEVAEERMRGLVQGRLEQQRVRGGRGRPRPRRPRRRQRGARGRRLQERGHDPDRGVPPARHHCRRSARRSRSTSRPRRTPKG